MNRQLFMHSLIYTALLFCCSNIYSGESGRLSWRPSAVPTTKMSMSKAEEILIGPADLRQKSMHSDYIVWAARSLPKEKATDHLKRLINEWESENKPTDEVWGKAVFSLGVVQTSEAKNYLIDLWEKHDQELSDVKKRLDIRLMQVTVPPLRVIADALHFYLSEESIREWFLERIEEANKIKPSYDIRDPNYWRRKDRYQLLHYLYRWDLIDSAIRGDRSSDISPKVLLDFYTFSKTEANKLEKSVNSLVQHLESLKPMSLTSGEAEWMECRADPHEYLLDSTALLLGKPLALEIWKTYLAPRREMEPSYLLARLWLIALWACFEEQKSDKPGDWVPTPDERAFIKAGVDFLEKLPEGHLRKLLSEALFGNLVCVQPSAEDNAYSNLKARVALFLEDEQIRRIRQLVFGRDELGKK